jgi:hypothetical protein
LNAQAHASPLRPRPGNPLAPYLALAGLWLLTLTLVPPRGDFPLNDDWMYAKVVQHLVDTGRYEASPYADPTFILQAYWGAAFVKMLGFSFETLRASTLVLALVALWAGHWAAREAGLSARWAFLVALTLMVNPLFLNLSYTFMTDVPFLALSLLAGAAYLRALRSDQVRWIAFATTIVLCAYFVRQFAAVLLVAALVPCFAAISVTRPRRFLRLGLAILLPIAVSVPVYLALPIGGFNLAQGWDWSRLGDTGIERATEILRHFAIAFTYLTVLATPIACASLALLFHRRSQPTTPATLATSLRGGPPDPGSDPAAASSVGPMGQSRFFATAALLAALALFIAWLIVPQWPHRLPNLGNVLYDLGVGPLLMPGMLDGLSIAAPLRIGPEIWWLITAGAFLGASALLAIHLRAALSALSASARRDPACRIELFLALWSLGMLLVLILPPVLARFDRYFVMAQVPATILAARRLAARRLKPARLAFAAAAAFWLFGLVCLQDYLAWNAARWRALAALQRDYAAPLEQINGGYEFNGWYHSDRFAEESRHTGSKVFGPLGWWTVKDDYRVSLRPDKRFEVIGVEPYFSWLGWQRREMLIQERTTPDANSEPFP